MKRKKQSSRNNNPQKEESMLVAVAPAPAQQPAQTFDDKVRDLTEAIAAVIEDPDCPPELYSSVMQWFDELHNLYGKPSAQEDARTIRRELPGFVDIMVRIEQRRQPKPAA
jgi:hypothetical protein